MSAMAGADVQTGHDDREDALVELQLLALREVVSLHSIASRIIAYHLIAFHCIASLVELKLACAAREAMAGSRDK